MATLDILIKTRLDKLDKLRSLEIDPFPSTVERKDKIADARNRIGKEAKVIGRIIAYRHQGKIAFLDIIDGSGKIQTVLKENDELISIFVKSVETAQRNMEKEINNGKGRSKIINR